MRSQGYRQLISALGEENWKTVLAIQRDAHNAKRREKVAARRREIIALLKNRPTVTNAELAEKHGVTVRTIERDRRALRSLLEAKQPCPVCGAVLSATPKEG